MEKLKIDFATVTHLEGNINYTLIYFENGDMLKKAITLKRFEEFLQLANNFHRIHKSILVNKNFIKWADELEVELFNGQMFNVSRRRKINLNEFNLPLKIDK